MVPEQKGQGKEVERSRNGENEAACLCTKLRGSAVCVQLFASRNSFTIAFSTAILATECVTMVVCMRLQSDLSSSIGHADANALANSESAVAIQISPRVTTTPCDWLQLKERVNTCQLK